MKALLVFDIDEKYIGAIGDEIKFINNTYKCNWKLKNIPEKKAVDANNITDLVEYRSFFDDIRDKLIIDTRLQSEKFIAMGWNACIDEILSDE